MSTSVLDSFAGGWCHPPFTSPPPPRPPPPGAQGAYGPHHRHTNNIWCDPGLYQPYPQPPRMSQPGVRAPHHPHPPSGFHMGGPPGCGGGRGGRGFGRGQGGGRGGGRGGHHPQHGGQNSNHGNSFNNKGMVSVSFDLDIDIAEVPFSFVLSVVAPETGQTFSSQFTSYNIRLSYQICCPVIFVGLNT